MPALHRADRREDGGFTLIELLVVMIIIGILAAIAIPTFLNQRNNGHRAAMKSDLKNAATAAESFVASGGAYAGLDTAALDAERGAGVTADVTVSVAANGTTGYCLEAVHAALPGETWYLDSATTTPSTLDCTGNAY